MIKSVIAFALGMFAYNAAQCQLKDEAVYLIKSKDVEISLDKNILKLNEHTSEEKIFYSNFDKYAKESIPYSDLHPISALEAETMIPVRNSYKKIKVSAFETKDLVQSGIFYGGYKRKDFVFPNIVNGAIGKVSYDGEIIEPHLIPGFYFEENIPVKNAAYSVTFPISVKIRYKVYGNLKNQVKFTETTTGKSKKYSWSLTNIPAFEKATDSPAAPYHETHVIFYIESFAVNGTVVKVSSDVTDLYHWMNSLINQVPTTGDYTLLNQQISALTMGAKANEEKAKNIFQWVQKNIKYVAFEEGMAGFIPREPSDVFTKRFGDCKDMAYLLKYMLTHAGMEAYPTWIGTRSKPYAFDDIPTNNNINHMICGMKVNDHFIFLDATDPWVTFGKPSSMIQGKQGLIGIGREEFKIVTIPTREIQENQKVDTIFLRIDNNNVLQGIFSGVLKGYKKTDFQAVSRRAEMKQNEKYVQIYFGIGDNNIQIKKLQVTGLKNQDDNALIKFDFTQPGYFKNIGDRIYLNLNLNKFLPGEKADSASRKQWIESDYLFEDESRICFTIPDGYSVTTLPADATSQWKEFGISTKYSIQERTIILEKKMFLNFLYLKPSQFPEWNKFIQSLTSTNLQSIILSKTK